MHVHTHKTELTFPYKFLHPYACQQLIWNKVGMHSVGKRQFSTNVLKTTGYSHTPKKTLSQNVHTRPWVWCPYHQKYKKKKNKDELVFHHIYKWTHTMYLRKRAKTSKLKETRVNLCDLGLGSWYLRCEIIIHILAVLIVSFRGSNFSFRHYLALSTLVNGFGWELMANG